MGRLIHRTVPLLLAALATSRVAGAARAQAAASSVIRGVVTDSASSPIVYAQVRLGGSLAAVTDSLGVFEISPRSDPPWSLEIRRIGYYAARLHLDGRALEPAGVAGAGAVGARHQPAG